MSYGLITLGLALAVSLLLFFAITRRRRKAPQQPPEKPVRLSPQAQLLKLQAMERFRGVRIESHCRASARLVGQDFAFETAPQLPLSHCDAPICACRYTGLPERRARSERRSGRDRRNSLRLEAEERRARRPRRKDDVNTWAGYNKL